MLRSVRKKLASSITNIEGVEDFYFSSWIRTPQDEQIELGEISSSLQDTSYLERDIPPPDNSEAIIGLETSEVLPEIKQYNFSKIKSNAVFFMMHTVSLKAITISEIEPKPIGYTAKVMEFLISEAVVKDIRIKFYSYEPVEYKLLIDSPAPVNYKFAADLPEITDHLSEMLPEVYNIDLLKVEELEDSVGAVDIYRIDISTIKKGKSKKIALQKIKKPKRVYKVKVPGMGSYASSLSEVRIKMLHSPDILETVKISFPDASILSKEVSLSGTLPYKYYDASDEELIEVSDFQVNELKHPKAVKDVLKFLLKNVHKVEWDKRKDLQLPLEKYEDAGAKFLAEHDYALLQDEFGLSIEKETIAALKFLFESRYFRSVLIVSSRKKVGDVGHDIKHSEGLDWANALSKWVPEINYLQICGSDDERADLWKVPSLIYLVDYETVINDSSSEIFKPGRLNRFDCIILDEMQQLLMRGEKGSRLLSSLKPNALWALSSLVEPSLKEKVNKKLNENIQIENVKIRSKEKIGSKAPLFIWKENWLNHNEEQVNVYNETIVDCQKDLRRVLESGNPFRFQANIYTLLHRLKQVSNFAPGNSESPKTDVLCEHVSIIAKNKKKVLILSQYDRLGTKKIEKVFEEKGINFILAQNSLSAEDMNKSLALFKNKKDITAFVTDAKLTRLKFSDYNIPYIIKFDQWWNPASVWEVEDLFDHSKNQSINEKINVYSYCVRDSIDERIKKLLSDKKLLNKNIMEVLPAKVLDELISVDEWLNFFNMPTSETDEKVLQTADQVLNLLKLSTLNYFRTILSKFFYKIGYTNVDIVDEEGTSSFNVVGEGKRNKRKFNLYARIILDDIVKVKTVKEVSMELGSSQNNKIFIITKGKFAKGCERAIRENVTLLDGIALANYLIQFGLIAAKDTSTAEKDSNIVEKDADIVEKDADISIKNSDEEQKWGDLRHD